MNNIIYGLELWPPDVGIQTIVYIFESVQFHLLA